MSPAVVTWIQALGLLIPLVQSSVEAIAGLIATIRASQGLTQAQADALVASLRAGLAERAAEVDAVPVFRPPLDTP